MKRTFLVLSLHAQGFRGLELEDATIHSVKLTRYARVKELETVIGEGGKSWSFKGTKYLMLTVKSHGFEPENIKIPGLLMHREELWDPLRMYGDEAYEYFPRSMVDGPKRFAYAFEDYTGYGFYGPDTDPVYDATCIETFDERYRFLAKLWEAYPQCIDALVHMGHCYLNCFDQEEETLHALNCYRGALLIAERNMGAGFDGVLEWSVIENRPYLRARQGYYLALWRLGRFEEAMEMCEKTYRMCPMDNLGARFVIDSLRNREQWVRNEGVWETI